MDKRLVFPQNVEDRREAFFVKEDRNYLVKRASDYHPAIAKYIEGATPLKDLIQVLITALGSFEYWGQNVNGDRFPEVSLAHEGDDYGYKTFLTNANYFTHHVNKDPALAKGKVLHSVWNDKAKRVELVIGIDVNKDPEAVNEIDNGNSLCFSMGAKVPYDICSICGNRAKTRMEYCDHLKYMMNQIDPVTGKLIGALNTLPKFFDISRVLIPADKTAYMWTKVASAANPYRSIGSAALADLPPGKIADLDYLTEKVASAKEAAVDKRASMTKRFIATSKAHPETKFSKKMEEIIPKSHAALEATSPDLPEELIKKISETAKDPSRVISSMVLLGILPRQSEIAHIEKHCPSCDCARVRYDKVSPNVVSLLQPYMAERSYARPILLRRTIILANKLEDPKNHEFLKKTAATVAEGFRKQVTQIPKAANPGAAAGIAAAIYWLLNGKLKGADISDAIKGLLAMAIGAGAAQAGRVLSKPTTSGELMVDDPTRGFYNNDWQSRFVRMQARPVTVIKTGADYNKLKDLRARVFVGIPALYGASHVAKMKQEADEASGHKSGLITRTLANNPGMLSAGLIAEHAAGSPISRRIHDVLHSAKRIHKTASITNLEFLDNLPEDEQDWIWDVAILHSADRINKAIGG